MSREPQADSAAVRLAEADLHLAGQIATRLKRRYAWLGAEELKSYSLWGLTMAAVAYQPSHEIPFADYASSKGLFLAIDQMRRERVLVREDAGNTPRFVRLPGPDEAGERAGDIADARCDPPQRKAEIRDLLQCLMSRLAPRDRQILRMHYVQGRGFDQIGRLLGRPARSVETHCRRLITRLRDLAARLWD
ncbi:MAG: hypothetical protein BIFFINMI_00290 [Phycisphaerae bacterium]|nr:hypothetical protein [Phycisphaerae bacterium]